MHTNKNRLERNFLSKPGFNKATLLRKIILLSFLSLLFIFSVPGFSDDLCQTKHYYNVRSTTWSYLAPCTSSYNCLGWATGSMTFEWAWYNYPTSNEVSSFLDYYYQCYTSGGPNMIPYIISYGGTSNSIGHFARVRDSSSTTAKWGHLNRLLHGSWDPYKEKSGYGYKQVVYYKLQIPNMQVNISGPGKGTNSGTYTWCANASNGQTPYTYAWEISYPDDNDYQPWETTKCITQQLPLDFDLYLKVTVKDATGRQTTAYASCMNISKPMASGLAAAMDEYLLANDLANMINDPAFQGNTSSNPYDYINNEDFRRIVDLGPKALLSIRKMILESNESGLKEYILAIAAETIAQVNLKGDTFAWVTGQEWPRQWDKHMRNLPKTAANIFASTLSYEERNKALIKLGTLAIPFIVDEIACGNRLYYPALRALTKDSSSMIGIRSGEDLISWAKKNAESIGILRDIANAYVDK